MDDNNFFQESCFSYPYINITSIRKIIYASYLYVKENNTYKQFLFFFLLLYLKLAEGSIGLTNYLFNNI
jgi:hypothetical protein